MTMDEILIPDTKRIGDAHELPQQPIAAPRWSGLGFAVCKNGQPTNCPGKGSICNLETFSNVVL